MSTTGIAGLTLGGGWGYLARTYGLASDNLLSVDLVTANGQLLTATAERSCYWASHSHAAGCRTHTLCPSVRQARGITSYGEREMNYFPLTKTQEEWKGRVADLAREIGPRAAEYDRQAQYP
jgi:hypothetical protein